MKQYHIYILLWFGIIMQPLQASNSSSMLRILCADGKTRSFNQVVCNQDLKTIRLVKNLKTFKVNVIEKGVTGLICAANMGYYEVAKELLTIPSINPNIKDDKYKATALGWAVVSKHIKIVRILLQFYRTDVNSRNLEENSPLIMASYQGYDQIVRLLLTHPKVDVNMQGKDKGTPLTWAAQKGYKKIVTLLLHPPEIDYTLGQMSKAKKRHKAKSKTYITSTKNGFSKAIKINLQDTFGCTALFWGATKGYVSIVESLLKHPSIKTNLVSNMNISPLMVATSKGHIRILDLLLNHKNTRVNMQRKKTGETALIYASQKGYTNIVKLFLNHPKTKVNLQDKIGGTALSHAVANRHKETVELLIRHNETDLYIKDNNQQDILDLASGDEYLTQLIQNYRFRKALEGNDINKVRELLEVVHINMRDDHGNTPLIWLCKHGTIEMIRELLKSSKIDVNCQNNQGLSALMVAVEEEREDVVVQLCKDKYLKINLVDIILFSNALRQAIAKNNENIIKILVNDDRTNINIRHSNQAETPLMYACRLGYERAVELLLGHKSIEVNAQNYRGETALIYASFFGHDKIVARLLKVPSIDVYVKDNSDHKDAYAWAKDQKKVDILLNFSLFFMQGQNLIGAVQEGNLSLFRNLLQEPGSYVNVRDKERKGTALMYATYWRDVEMVTGLIKHPNINVNATDEKYEETALMLGASKGYSDMVDILLTHKNIDVNKRNNQGNNALILAVYGGFKKIVISLLKKSAIDVTLANHEQVTSLIIAAQKGYTEIVVLLLRKFVENNLVSQNGSIVLKWAAYKGYTEILKLLLDSTAVIELNLKDIEVAIQYAREKEHTQVIEILNTYEKQYTPLYEIINDSAV